MEKSALSLSGNRCYFSVLLLPALSVLSALDRLDSLAVDEAPVFRLESKKEKKKRKRGEDMSARERRKNNAKKYIKG